MAMWALAGAAALSAVSSLAQGAAADKAAKYTAAVREQEATAAEQLGVLEEERHRDNLRKFMATQRAAGGASGISLEDGPVGQLAQEAAIEGERDALLIRYARDAQASTARTDAALERFKGKNARRQGYLGAGASLLKAGAYGYAGYQGLGSGSGSSATVYEHPGLR